MTALDDVARAAQLRITQMADGTVHVYDRHGNASVGRLHLGPAGWRGVDDLTGDATDACDSAADALVALIELHRSAS